MIFDSLIAPLSVFSFKTGTTLIHGEVNEARPSIQNVNILGWVCRVNDDSFLGLVVGHEVGIVVSRALPCSAIREIFQEPLGYSYTWVSIGCAYCGQLQATLR